MITKKTCFKCLEDKPLSEYYKHKQMADGHLNKCKYCTKKEVKERENKLRNNPDWLEKEKIRSREKYHRLQYRGKHKPSHESKKKNISSYKEKYPEKESAKNKTHSAIGTGKMHKPKTGWNYHHWSYNEEHYLDVIPLTIKDHSKAHIYLTYDQERMMYRRFDTNELLNTKEKHFEFITWAIKNLPD